MTWLTGLWHDMVDWLPALLVLLHLLIFWATIVWILMTKVESTSAVAWCLIVILVPYFGALFFVMFGYQHVDRPLRRKRKQLEQFRGGGTGEPLEPVPALNGAAPGSPCLHSLQRVADRVGAHPLTHGNHVDFYHHGPDAFTAMLEAIRSAQHHIHLEFFIVQPDELGRHVLEELTTKANAGVQVRLLYDAMGSHRMRRSLLVPLQEAGGETSVFLPLNPLRRRIQINMRNHRKLLIVDGVVGFTGGLNIGDEYVGKDPYFGYWRDTHLRLRGPGVADLQRVFCEDWDYAAGESLRDGAHAKIGASYFKTDPGDGPYPVQVIDSGPDRDLKSIREVYFAAILQARKRVWIASPYFVPDAGILDALRLAAYLGVDVRFLGQFQPDKWIPQYAAQYYWNQMLQVGVKVYQYSRGMLHSKVMMIDDDWASVGSANLDNRSLHLNFELNCLIYSEKAVAELAAAFESDLEYAIRLDPKVFARRPFANRLLENACRLMSPVL